MPRLRRSRLRSAAVPLAAVLCAALAAGCSTAGRPSSSAAPAGGAPAAGVPAPAHVVVVVLENKDVGQVLHSGDAPYLDSLAAAGAEFTDAHAETHPSQPNYLALFSGSTQGVHDDDCIDGTLDAPSLGGQLIAAGRSFTGYAEDLPEVGFTGCQSGEYARKHAPWTDFSDVPAQDSRPLSDLPDDLAKLPTVAFVIPNLCHDMHDCDVATGDRWMRDNLDTYVSWARTHDSLLIVTTDESEGSGDGPIATLFVGPMVAKGQYDERIDHYRVLRTIEDMYGLKPLGHAAEADPITDVWTTAS